MNTETHNVVWLDPKKVIDRTCVILTTSTQNQKDVIDTLISLGGSNSNNPYDKGNCFEKGHKVIFIYGHTGINDVKHNFSFCITKYVARNQIPCGELFQNNITRYFRVKSNAGREKLLSRKNANIYSS